MARSDAERQRAYRERRKAERLRAQIAEDGVVAKQQDEDDLRIVGAFVQAVMELPLVQHDGSIDPSAVTRSSMAAGLVEEVNRMLEKVGRKAGPWDGPQFVRMAEGEAMDHAREVVRVVHKQLRAHEAEGRTVSAALRAARTVIRGSHLESVPGLSWLELYLDSQVRKEREVWSNGSNVPIWQLLGNPEDE